MMKQNKELLASVYNTLATLVPVPSEEYSTKHAFCLQKIREILQYEGKENQLESIKEE